MRRLIKVFSLMLCLFMFVGCSQGKLSENFNEDELTKAAEVVVNNLNANNYSEIIANSSDELKSALSANKLEEAWVGFNSNIGKFDSITKMSFGEKDGYAIVIVNTKYENAKVTFTLSYDKEMKLSGIFMK